MFKFVSFSVFEKKGGGGGGGGVNLPPSPNDTLSGRQAGWVNTFVE